MKRTVFAPTRLVGAMAAVLALAGCASISPDGLRGAVQSHTASRLPDGAQLPPTDLQARDAAQQRIDEWLRQPLDMDQSVRIALLNNPGLQARLAQLGVQDADRVQALTLPNPTLALGRMVNSDEREIERQLSFGLVSLITLPWRSRWQGMQMEQATLTAAQDVLRLAADTRRAWLRAVAARQQLAASERMHEAAEAGAELARRMARVGNFSRLQQARELSIQQDTAAQLARARLAATAEHEQLARLMGLWGRRIDFKLPDQLPAIPQAATQLRAGDDAEATALRERLDLRALRRDLDHLGERRGWARAGAIFGDIGLGYSRNTATDRATGHSDVTRGWEIDLPLPLFDWGGAASGRARAELQRSAAQLQQGAIQARAEARSSWMRYRTAWDLAHQQQAEVLPLRRFIQDETMLRYNGMFVSVWQLLAEARSSAQAVATATDAQRDFWLAETDLQLALTGTSPGAIQAAASAAAPTPTNEASH
ncbi:TolC family protein [Delftia tsuruhatensis]|uniref:TolC family protein n=1 Tax=Delftia TaxID=80865 RepID=UPI0006407A8A|nr:MULTISPECIES: TolC family protein [Delftia]MDH0772604.1 TolC family protein [Delftia tsuruhatensis]MDH1456919.1 TolC family protein [Delftia tsuruhatensis]MDH1821712.1 TolC family protein [Delftia tsuruhatensis]WGG08783.1 TolC family protein [Delftia tsuruhatensis]